MWGIRRRVDKGKDSNKTLYKQNRQTVIKFNNVSIFDVFDGLKETTSTVTI